MSQASLFGRRVLVIGQGLASTGSDALGQAELEFGEPDRVLGASHGPEPDLVVIDAACAPPNVLSAMIEALGRKRQPPAAILVGEGLPTSAVRALLRLPRSDVLEAPFTNDDLARMAQEMLAVDQPGAVEQRADGRAGLRTAAQQRRENRNPALRRLFDIARCRGGYGRRRRMAEDP